MFKTNKINSTIKPNKFISLNNGVWYYSFNIDENTITTKEGEKTMYEYVQVRISGKPTLSKCYEAIINSYRNEDESSLAQILANPVKNEEAEQLAKELYELIEIDFGVKPKPTELEVEKSKMLKKIDEYDTSIDVNSFYLNGLQVWLDKATRVGLMNSLNIEKNAGKEISTIWFGNIKLELNTEAAIQMLSALELYALECYNKTAEHKVNVNSKTSVTEIVNYDYTQGYPDKLNFTV